MTRPELLKLFVTAIENDSFNEANLLEVRLSVDDYIKAVKLSEYDGDMDVLRIGRYGIRPLVDKGAGDTPLMARKPRAKVEPVDIGRGQP